MTTSYRPQLVEHINNGFSLLFSDAEYSIKLAANTEKTLTIDLNGGLGASLTTKWRYVAIFKPQVNSTIFVNLNTTAAVPGTSAFELNKGELIIPGDGRTVKDGDVLHFITPDTNAFISVSLYAINT